MKSISQEIAERARDAGYSLPMVAEAAGYGKTMLYGWLKGENASIAAVQNVACVLGLRIELRGKIKPLTVAFKARSLGRPAWAVSQQKKQLREKAPR